MFKRWIVFALTATTLSFTPIKATHASDLPIAQIVKAIADVATAIAIYFEDKDKERDQDKKEDKPKNK